jgi:hypothetical protein
LSIFRKSVEEIQLSLKYENNNGYLREDLGAFVIVKGTAIAVRAWTGSGGSRRLKFPDFMTIGTWRG